MRIQRMRAVFGRLEDRTLSLEPGLNVISGGNEAGKSTWAAFLAAMLYGVDTRARSKGAEVPVKVKYAPWSGKPMAGRMELDWNGRNIVLERSSGQTPLGTLKAFDRDSGSPIPELGGADCGEILTGVEESVFRKSAFLQQRGQAVSADPQLEKRLSGLVAGGSEDYAFTEIDAKLKKLQNALQFNQMGLIPKARAELNGIDEALDRAARLLRQQAKTAAELKALREEEAELVRINAGTEALRQRDLRRAAAESRSALEAAQSERAALEARCAGLPAPDVLDSMKEDVRELRAAVESAEMEDRMDPVEAPAVPKDERFPDPDPKKVRAQADREAAFVRRANDMYPQRERSWAMAKYLIPAVTAVIAAWLLLLFSSNPNKIYLFSVCGITVLVGLILFIEYRQRAASRRALDYAAQILARYGCVDSEGIDRAAEDYLRKLEAFRAAQEAAARKTEARSARSAQLAERETALLDRMRAGGADCGNLDAAERWLRQAGDDRLALDQAQRDERRAAEQYERLRPHAGQGLSVPEEDLGEFASYDLAVVRDRLSRCRAAMAPLRSEADRLDGAISQIGDTLALHARREQTQARIARLEQRYAAILLARRALKDADEDLRARFAPMLCRRAGELFSELTGGAYDRVSLDRDMQVTVHPAGSAVDRPLSCLSGGTVDQLWLALRLAICDLLLPEAPIVLDDALVYFDDERLKTALTLLRKLGKTRQILLFTCQDREKRILDQKISE